MTIDERRKRVGYYGVPRQPQATIGAGLSLLATRALSISGSDMPLNP